MENIYNEEQIAAMKDEFIELIGSVETASRQSHFLIG